MDTDFNWYLFANFDVTESCASYFSSRWLEKLILYRTIISAQYVNCTSVHPLCTTTRAIEGAPCGLWPRAHLVICLLPKPANVLGGWSHQERWHRVTPGQDGDWIEHSTATGSLPGLKNHTCDIFPWSKAVHLWTEAIDRLLDTTQNTLPYTHFV